MTVIGRKEVYFVNISDDKTGSNGQFMADLWFNCKQGLSFKNKKRKGGQTWNDEFPAKVGIPVKLNGYLAGVMQNGFRHGGGSQERELR